MMGWLKIVLPLAIAAGLFGAGVYWGIGQGTEIAQSRHQKELAELRISANKSLDTQAAYYKKSIDELVDRLFDAEYLNASVQQREQELVNKVAHMERRLQSLQGKIYETDLGTCSVSPSFDELLYSAATAARGNSERSRND